MSKKKEPKREIKTATVSATVRYKDALFLRMDVGTAESAKGTFHLSTDVGTGVPIITTPDGRQVVFGWEALIRAADEMTSEDGK